MEVLNALIHKADEWLLLKPLGVNGVMHHASFYADDLVWFVAPEQKDLLMVRSILSLFEGCSDLGCNMNKCQLAPIRCAPN
jgi:ketosteroid isomerase-like protein